METTQFILGIIAVLLAIPLGMLLARSTKEELKKGRIAFIIIIGACFFISVGFIASSYSAEEKAFVIMGALFIGILAGISLLNSHTSDEPKKQKKEAEKKQPKKKKQKTKTRKRK